MDEQWKYVGDYMCQDTLQSWCFSGDRMSYAVNSIMKTFIFAAIAASSRLENGQMTIYKYISRLPFCCFQKGRE